VGLKDGESAGFSMIKSVEWKPRFPVVFDSLGGLMLLFDGSSFSVTDFDEQPDLASNSSRNFSNSWYAAWW
jgi:hypothetical protein